MLGDSININNLSCNPVIRKKIAKTIFKKMLFLVHSCTKKVSAWATPKLKNNSFCCKNNKADHKVSKKFLFYQNTMCFSFLFCDVFFWLKRVIYS